MPTSPRLPLPLPLPLPLALALVVGACTPTPDRAEGSAGAESAGKPVAEDPPAPEPAPAEPADTRWTLEQFSDASKSIAATAKRDPAELPRVGSPTFEHLTDLDHLAKLSDGLGRERLVGLTLAFGPIQAAYREQSGRDPSFEREYLIVLAATLIVSSKLPRLAAANAEAAAAARSKPAQLQSLLRLRYGIHQLTAELLAFRPRSDLRYGFACEQLAEVIDGIVASLLPEERNAALAQLDRCASEGASADAVSKLRAALDDASASSPAVTELLEEHRAFAAAQASEQPANEQPAP